MEANPALLLANKYFFACHDVSKFTIIPHNCTYVIQLCMELAKRLLMCWTPYGMLALVHLEKANKASPRHDEIIELHEWIFNHFYIVMGDMNCTVSAIKKLKLKTDICINTNPNGTYLPFKNTTSNTTSTTQYLPCFDMCVTHSYIAVVDDNLNLCGFNTHSVHAHEIPRERMHNVWPSDHMPVITECKRGKGSFKTATWNIADPVYLSKFHPSANQGFDWLSEDDRLSKVIQIVEKLLNSASVVGLIEVPHKIVKRLTDYASNINFSFQYICTPSSLDNQATEFIGLYYSNILGHIPEVSCMILFHNFLGKDQCISCHKIEAVPLDYKGSKFRCHHCRD